MFRLKLTLAAAFLGSLLLCSGSASADEVYKLAFERSYSTTTVQLPSLCRAARAQGFCNRMAGFFARSFERELIMEQAAAIDFDDPNPVDLSFSRLKASQNVFMFFLQNKSAPIASLYALSFQYFSDGRPSRSKITTFNFDIESERNLAFGELFADSELAAMLIAREIEDHYRDDASLYLPLLVTATQYLPTNFIVVDDGLRMFFAPGVVGKDVSKMQSFKINLEKLAAAGPKSKWWPDAPAGVTTAESAEEGSAADETGAEQGPGPGPGHSQGNSPADGSAAAGR